MIWALHQPAVTYLSQLLATFTAEVSFFDDFPTMRAGRLLFILHPSRPAKLVDKILLAFAGNLGSLAYADMAVTVGNSRFLNLEQAHFHGSLRGAVVIRSGTLNQVALLTHPAEQALLTNRMAVLLQNLRKVAY